MATLLIDLIEGKEYLFDKELSVNTGGTNNYLTTVDFNTYTGFVQSYYQSITGFTSYTGYVENRFETKQDFYSYTGNAANTFQTKQDFYSYTGNVDSTYLKIATYNNYLNSLKVKQIVTTGTSVTINYLATELLLNPSTEILTYTITMPATANISDGHDIKIGFGGTITIGGVVRNLTISPNTSQTILGGSNITYANAGDGYVFRWDSTTSCWHIY